MEVQRSAEELPATMRAAVLHGQGDLRVETMPRPVAGPGEVVLRLTRCGICGSDIRSYSRGPSARYSVPIILGHEFVGTVAEVGAGVRGVRVGDRATAAPAIPCGTCLACRRGDDNLCERLLDFGINIPGGLAEFVRIPARSVAAGALVLVPPEMSVEAAILGEPIGCCLRGLRRGGVGPGSIVVVLGDGPIGLTHVMLACRAGAKRVLAVGHNPGRLASLAAAGAEIVDGTSNGLEAIRERLGPNLADVVVAAAPDPAALAMGLELTRPGGTVVAFGGLAGDPRIAVDGNRLHYGEQRLVGSFNCTTADFREAIDLAATVDTRLYGARIFPLDDVAAAFEEARSRRILKAVIDLEPPE